MIVADENLIRKALENAGEHRHEVANWAQIYLCLIDLCNRHAELTERYEPRIREYERLLERVAFTGKI